MEVAFAGLAVVAAGLAAGVSFDRAAVAMPAWRRVGLEPWATFSRQADLRNGLLLYPVIGAAPLLLSIATAIVLNIDHGKPSVSTPVYVAVVLAVLPLLATGLAAPNMLRIRFTCEPTVLRQAFDGFARWHAIRAALQVLLFGATIWTLVAVASR